VIRILALLAVSALLTGCVTTPPPSVLVSGNGACLPSQSLPSHKAVAAVPASDTQIDPLYDLLVDERKAHGDDVRDYNTLWDECVGKGKAPPRGR